MTRYYFLEIRQVSLNSVRSECNLTNVYFRSIPWELSQIMTRYDFLEISQVILSYVQNDSNLT